MKNKMSNLQFYDPNNIKRLIYVIMSDVMVGETGLYESVFLNILNHETQLNPNEYGNIITKLIRLGVPIRFEDGIANL